MTRDTRNISYQQTRWTIQHGGPLLLLVLISSPAKLVVQKMIR